MGKNLQPIASSKIDKGVVMKRCLMVFMVMAVFATAGTAMAMCLDTHVQCGYIGGRVGMDRCCPRELGCCGEKRDRCCERGESPRPAPMPTPSPTPTPGPYTGWAQLTMKNNSNIDLSLSVDGASACVVFKGLQCPTQVRVGWRSFAAKKMDGTVVAAGYHNFKRGESYTWPVNYQEEEEESPEPGDNEEESEEATLILNNQLDEDLLLYVDDEPRPRCRAEANDECETAVTPGPHKLKAVNAQGKQKFRRYNFKPGEETTWSIWQ